MRDSDAPVIAIDGPGGSGKGTISFLLAQRLGWHLLDSGAIYRVLALAAERHNIAIDNEAELAVLGANLNLQFNPAADEAATDIVLEGEQVNSLVRTEDCGVKASQLAAFGVVREALLERQRAFRREPGLVADGRDMGTVVFPEAALKIFLTASAEERAKRRYKQLKAKGFGGSLRALFEDIRERDERDARRAVSPLRPAEDAMLLDSSELSIEDVFEKVLAEAKSRGLV